MVGAVRLGVPIGTVLWCLILYAVTDRAAFLGMISVPASWVSWLIGRDQRKEDG